MHSLCPNFISRANNVIYIHVFPGLGPRPGSCTTFSCHVFRLVWCGLVFDSFDLEQYLRLPFLLLDLDLSADRAVVLRNIPQLGSSDIFSGWGLGFPFPAGNPTAVLFVSLSQRLVPRGTWYRPVLPLVTFALMVVSARSLYYKITFFPFAMSQ